MVNLGLPKIELEQFVTAKRHVFQIGVRSRVFVIHLFFRWLFKAPCFRWPAVDLDGDGVFDRIDRCNNTPVGCTVDKWGCETDSDKDGVCDGRDLCHARAGGAAANDDRACAALAEAAAELRPVQRQIVDRE